MNSPQQEIQRKLYPTEFLRNFVSQGIRPDGRKLHKFRKTTLVAGSLTKTNGSSFVKLGNTTVVAGIRAEIGPQPTINESSKRVAINFDLPPLCSSKFRGGKLPDEANSIAQRLNSLFDNHSSFIISPEALAYDKEGKYSWYLYIDLICLDYDGSVFDACLIACFNALKNVSLKNIDGESTKLNINNALVSVTFALFDGILLVDPTNEEEIQQSSSITIVFEPNSQKILQIYKPGGATISDEQLNQCISLSFERKISY